MEGEKEGALTHRSATWAAHSEEPQREGGPPASCLSLKDAESALTSGLSSTDPSVPDMAGPSPSGQPRPAYLPTNSTAQVGHLRLSFHNSSPKREAS